MSQVMINDTTTLLSSSRPYTKSGIGGAVNIRKASSHLAVPSAPRVVPTPSKGNFLTGIGGAGNSHSYEERASISFDEEMARRAVRKQSVVGSWHHGIGGAGNRSSFVGTSASSSVEPNCFFTSAMGTQSGADRVKERVASYFAGSKRNSVADEKDVDSMSIDDPESWARDS
ncbi:hypothetical protein BKA65DRAFT_205829 [Rhexocercosporidium sp. MPI-PUGE-AT-0058]|nr:hypothetical protein BKA65DRAFT_205829 [Rhexocercosporidium sp. MPI-PUGE-AT-0058]